MTGTFTDIRRSTVFLFFLLTRVCNECGFRPIGFDYLQVMNEHKMYTALTLSKIQREKIREKKSLKRREKKVFVIFVQLIWSLTSFSF